MPLTICAKLYAITLVNCVCFLVSRSVCQLSAFLKYFSALADVGRGALSVIDAVAVPVLEFGLDDLTGGVAGTALQVTGLDDFLQQGLDKLTEMHGLDFTSSSNKTAPYFTDIVKDPRLLQNYNKLMDISRKKTGNKSFSTNSAG